MIFEENLKKNNLILPKAADPVGSYVATKIINKILFVSGQISMGEDGKLIKGKLGKDLDTNEGYNAAKRCALSIISQAKKACNDDLSKVPTPGQFRDILFKVIGFKKFRTNILKSKISKIFDIRKLSTVLNNPDTDTTFLWRIYLISKMYKHA